MEEIYPPMQLTSLCKGISGKLWHWLNFSVNHFFKNYWYYLISHYKEENLLSDGYIRIIVYILKMILQMNLQMILCLKQCWIKTWHANELFHWFHNLNTRTLLISSSFYEPILRKRKFIVVQTPEAIILDLTNTP